MKAMHWLAVMTMTMAITGALAADDPAAPQPASDASTAPAAEPAATPAAAPADTPAAAPAETAVEPAPASAAVPAPAPASAAAASATGTVIFFRPSRFMGAAMGFIVREGTSELGKLRNGTFFTIQAPAGVHHYVVHSESKDELTVEVEAGETYYVQGALGMGLMVGRPNISPSDAAAFEAVKGKLKEAKPLNGAKSAD